MNTNSPETLSFRAVSSWRAQEELNHKGAASGDVQNTPDKKPNTTQNLPDSRLSDDAGVKAGGKSATPSEHVPATVLQPDYAQCRTANLPPELARVVKAWPELSEPFRAAILAMVHSATGGKG